MRKVNRFNHISLDGYFTDKDSSLNWVHMANDPEFDQFVQGNAQSGGELIFGRITYQMMASYWPTPMAHEQNPIVAERMNALQKVVFSRTLDSVSWQNTRLVKGNLADEILNLKKVQWERFGHYGKRNIGFTAFSSAFN